MKSVRRFLDNDTLILDVEFPLRAGTQIRLLIRHFESELSLKNDNIVLQIPSDWETQRSWFLGVQNKDLDNSIFPHLSDPQQRSVFRLCLTYKNDLISR